MSGAVTSEARQTPKLRAVHEEPVDIGALMRAERNDPERWRRVHEYDGPVVCWQTRVRRWWRG